jgi:hypothetical protein
VLLWGARLSVSSKQGDVTLYLVDLSLQDGPYADTRVQLAGIAVSELRSPLTTPCQIGTIVRQERR